LQSISDGFKTAIREPAREIKCRVTFDEGVLGNPANPTFTRNSIAYTADGVQVAANVPRFEVGKFGKGVLIEEGTTNLATSVKDFTAWSKLRVTVTADAAMAPDGTLTADKIICTGDIDPYVERAYNLGQALGGKTFTFSVWVWTDEGQPTDMRLYMYDNTVSYIKSQDFVITTTPQRYVLTYTFPTECSNTIIRYRIDLKQVPAAGDYIYAWGAQLEQKPYVTTFIDGIRAPETLTVPTAGVLTPNEGTIEFWWNPLGKTPQTYPSLISVGGWSDPITKDWMSIYWGSGWSDANTVSFGMKNKDGTSNFSCWLTLNPTPYTWYYVAASWSFTTKIAKLTIYKPDGSFIYSQRTVVGEPPTFDGWDKFYVLQGWGGASNRANCIIDDLRISNIARTDDEIAEAYSSGQPLPADEWTKYKLNFDDNINNSSTPTELVQKIDYSADLVTGDDFEIGTATMAMINIGIIEDEDNAYTNYDYTGKTCNIELGVVLEDETIEYCSIGKYTVDSAERKNNTITLKCVDNMYKAEKDYVSDLMYPTTLGEILSSACSQAGITLATTSFANSDYVVNNEPVYEGITCRRIFAQISELAGGYAQINRNGELEIRTLGSAPVRDITKDNYIELKINEAADARIDKVIVKVGDEQAEAGQGDNIYTIVNNMFVQNPADVVDALYNVLSNVSYTACTFKWQGDFALDLGDKVTIDEFQTYVLNRKITYAGGLREETTAPAKSNVAKVSTSKGSLTLDIENVKTQIRVVSGEIQQVVERVENLVVGANNRLYGSQTQIPFYFNNGSGTVQLFGDQRTPYYKVVSNQNIDLFAAFPDSQFAEPLGELGVVTISLDVLVGVDRQVTIDGNTFDVPANRWTRISVTKEFNEPNTTRRIRVRKPFSRQETRDIFIGTKLIDSLTTNINTIYYRNLKVEKGTLPTGWTLTPEELEDSVDRYSTEIRQLYDSISLVATRNEQTGALEVTPESIVAAINTTDGVGKVKTVNFTVDENGATVENGALIVKDAYNAAIITADGLKAIFVFTSSGQFNGWQLVGTMGLGTPTIDSYQASVSVYIPSNFYAVRARLITKSAPSHITGWQQTDGIADGYYHGRNLRLYVVAGDNTIFEYPYASSYGIWYGAGGNDITNATWGGSWSPTGNSVQEKETLITDYLSPGYESVFMVQSIDNPSTSNKANFGVMKFDVIIEGFLRGHLDY
jgi:hypothetical protein